MAPEPPVAAHGVPFGALEVGSAGMPVEKETGPLAAEYVCGELCATSKLGRGGHAMGGCETRPWV